MNTKEAIMALPASASYPAWLAAQELATQEAMVLYRDYYDGDQHVPLTDRQRQYLGYNQDEPGFCLNYCTTVVGAVIERMIVKGFTCEDEAIQKAIAQILETSAFDEIQEDVYQAAVRDAEAFVLIEPPTEAGAWPRLVYHPRYTDTSVDGDGFGCKAHYPDNDPSSPMLYASKRWTERPEGSQEAIQRMNLYYPDRIERYRALSTGEDRIAWVPYSLDEDGPILDWVDPGGAPLGIAVIHFRNTRDRSELVDAVPVQDAVNKSAVDILGIADLLGFPILVARGFNPTKDQEAPEEDGSNLLTLYPGMILGPVPHDGGLDRLEAPDLTSSVNWLDSLILKLAQITETPVSRFQLTRQVASADSQKEQNAALLAKIRKKSNRFGRAWVLALKRALAVAQAANTGLALNLEALGDVKAIEADWVPAEVRDELDDDSQFWENAKAAKEAGVPLPAYLRLKGWSDKQIEIITTDPEYQERLALRAAGLAALQADTQEEG